MDMAIEQGAHQMKSLSVSKAREILSQLIKEVGCDHEPIQIKGAEASAVLLDEEDWRAIQETLYLLSVPGMRESIRDGLQTPIDKCAEAASYLPVGF